MFFSPVDIDFAGPHALERALHSKRADIDVREDHGEEQHRYNAVHHLRELHPGDVGDVEWEQQQITGDGNREAQAESAPEHQLFTGVEAARRSVLRLDESAALL